MAGRCGEIQGRCMRKACGRFAGMHKSDVTRLGKDARGCANCREVRGSGRLQGK